MNKKHNYIKEYVLTFIIATLVVVTFCLCFELNLLFVSEKKVNQEELNMANLSKFCTISELEKRRIAQPSDYLVDIKLAQIYESLEKFDKANEFYLSALKKSARSDFSLYSYAMFCANHSLYGTAATVAEELSSNNKYHNLYKAKIYKSLGDNLEKENQILAANKAFQVSYKYAKALDDDEYIKLITEKFAKSYIGVADYNIQLKNLQDAILNLNNSIRILDTPLARYKLGLINIDIDKIEADRFISSAFDENPYLVNPYIYNKLLNDLMSEAKSANKQSSLNYYSMKLNRFKKQLLKYYIYKDDIFIENVKIAQSKKLFSKNEKYILSFDLKNNTKFSLNSLFMKLEIAINSKTYTIEKKLLTYGKSLGYYEKLEQIQFELPKDATFITVPFKNDVIVKFYAKKRKNAPWTLIGIEQLNF